MSITQFSASSPFVGFDDFAAPAPFSNDPASHVMPVLRNFDRDDRMVLSRSSLGYEINEDDSKYQIAVDVPDVRSSDLSVELEHDGRVLHIFGGRKIQKADYTSEAKFDKRFTIGDNIETNKLTANLSDGVLVVTAPKKPEKENKPRKIDITESPHGSK